MREKLDLSNGNERGENVTVINDTLIYSSTGTAYEGGSEGKTDEGGSPVVQG